MKAQITDYKHFAVHDGDGICTTIFFKGCPLRCLWCHNPESLSVTKQLGFYAHKCVCVCPTESLVTFGQEVEVDDICEELLKDHMFYEESGGGVTISGSECLLQPEAARAILKKMKAKGIDTAFDTCGAVPWAKFEHVLPYVDSKSFFVDNIVLNLKYI